MLILPLDLRQRKSSRKMALVQPKVESLKKRYGNNPQLMQKKQQELFKKEGIRPLAGCLPMLITLPIFFAFFGAMRVLAAEQQVSFILNAQNISSIAAYTETATKLPSFLWVHNLWQPDSGLEAISTRQPKEFTSYIQQSMSSVSPQALHMMSQTGLVNYDYSQAVPVFLSGDAAIGAIRNYTCLSEIIIAKKRHDRASITDGSSCHCSRAPRCFFNKKLTMGQNPQTAQQGGKIMLWFFPIFSIYICATSNAAFAIYWLFANIYALAQTLVINLIYKKQDEKAKQGVIEEAT